ncbi:hypothetical protein SDC9_170579 [bioreactor metagenome]|uniref:Uncharacterized protein n=1 Tax=bioreactor metagenome TaxID=1076179 RepID=A0A645G8F8_9ZZZZ
MPNVSGFIGINVGMLYDDFALTNSGSGSRCFLCMKQLRCQIRIVVLYIDVAGWSHRQGIDGFGQ